MNDLDGNWSVLRFEEAVLNSFGFLTRDYGFRRLDANPSLVRFERNGIIVSIGLDRDSFEISATVSLSDSGEEFTVWELARLMGTPDVGPGTFLQASTTDRVERLVPILADALRKYGRPALDGDRGLFSRLRELQQRESEAFLRTGRLRWIREQVQTAWSEHDYRKVVQLLEEVRSDLSAAELKKLSYARKRMDMSNASDSS
jgi:hypothetical protein